MVSNPHALKLEPSDVGTIKKLTDRTEERWEKKKGDDRSHFEKQILGGDKKQNVIFSKLKVIEVEWKGMDCKPSTLKRLRGLCEEKRERSAKDCFRNQILVREGKREIEGWFQADEQLKFNCVVRIVSLSH